jgi:hypothetical protein
VSDIAQRLHQAREALSTARVREMTAHDATHYGGPEDRARHAEALDHFRKAQGRVFELQAELDAAARAKVSSHAPHGSGHHA